VKLPNDCWSLKNVWQSERNKVENGKIIINYQLIMLLFCMSVNIYWNSNDFYLTYLHTQIQM